MNSNFKISEDQVYLSGIYIIRNICNQKFYIGSAFNFSNRWWCHLSDLRAGKHTNKHLQASFNKNGEDSFTFSVLEVIDNKDDLLNREQHFIDTLQPHYNICKQVGRPPVYEWTDEMRQKHSEMMRNRVLSPEAKQNCLDALDRGRTTYLSKPYEERAASYKKTGDALRGRTLSEEHRKKCAIANLGNKHTEETKQAIRKANSNNYIIISPEGIKYEANNGLLLFGQQHGLDESALASCARGEYEHHKGWQCFRIEDFSEDKVQDPSSFRIKGATTYIVTKPDGTEETTNNLYEYARKNNLDGSSLCKVFKGKLPHHKQYRVREEGTELQPLPKRKKSTIDPTNTHHFICTAPDGTEYTTTNMPEFAREHGICKESMRLVAKGCLRQYKRWLCRYTPEQQAEAKANFEYQAKYPNGKPISPDDKQRIIDASRTPEVLEKRSKQRKGWKPTEQQVQNLSLGHCKRTFIITTPDGVEHITKQLVQFAKNLNISSTSLYKSVKTGKSCKGYTVREVFDDVI